MKLNLGQDSEARFGKDFEVEVEAIFAAGVWPVFFLKLGLNNFYGEADVQLRF